MTDYIETDTAHIFIVLTNVYHRFFNQDYFFFNSTITISIGYGLKCGWGNIRLHIIILLSG